MSQLKVNSIVPVGGKPSGGGGGIIQTVTATTTSKAAEDCSTNAFRNGMAFNCTITPTSTSSKVMLFYSISLCTESTVREVTVRPIRGSTAFLIGDADGSRTRGSFARLFSSNDEMESISFSCLDSPNTTSAINYTFDYAIMNSGCFLIRNGVFSDSDNASSLRGVSSITAMEVSG
tara:strand:+ start:710 stop:1237 length:528 start_codon:yes stop_codon:yes gene_type:complete